MATRKFIITFAVTLILRVAQVHAEETADRIGPAWQDARNPIVTIFKGERLDLWSLRPVQRHPLPTVQRANWPRQPLDVYILAQVEGAGGGPAAEAERQTLARRLYFDLAGLPPTPDQTRDFLADAAPDAYERLVDRLLAAPSHGEHAARMWLDVVRYSDSNGFDWDEFRRQAWRYRDYLVRSFNSDKPYPQFIREQLAGDELLAGSPQTPAEREMLLATGFLRMGPQDNAAPLFNEQARARHELLVDLVETTGSAFLGLTFSCCRCHDHKYDPLSQVDHYRLRAFFEAVKYGDDLPLDLPDEQQQIEKHNAALDQRLEKLQKQRVDLLAAAKKRLQAEGTAEPSDELANKSLTEAEQKKKKAIEAELGKSQQKKRKFDHALLMTDGAPAGPTHLLEAGDHKTPREAISPGFISILDPNAVEISKPVNPQTQGRRLTLANWIAASDNPLTSRVLANRLWQMHFGQGLVATPNDFGLAGARPASLEALDWLASEASSRDRTIKQLQRAIVTSATYRQVSARPTSRSLPSAPALAPAMRRLSAEQLRDALLAVSGLLTSKSAGPPIWPELPAEVLQANPAFLDDNAEKVKGWYPSPPHEQHARSLFLIQKRTVRVPFLETFDLPENMTSCARRNTSTIAPQALSLLNSPLAIAAATALAQRVQRETPDSRPEQIARLYRLALQRAPTAEEWVICERFLQDRSLAELCRVVLNLNEFAYVD